MISSDKNKKGSDFYVKYGFIPSNIKRESVSCLLEYAYDDWCIARMAQEMGKEDIYKKYIERSAKLQSMCLMVLRGFFAESVWMAIGNHLLIRLTVGRAYTEATGLAISASLSPMM